MLFWPNLSHAIKMGLGYIKGGAKKPSFFKIWYTIFSWTVGLKRLSFSGLGVLMRTPSPEKDNLLRPTVPEKIVYQILKNEVFFAPPFSRCPGASGVHMPFHPHDSWLNTVILTRSMWHCWASVTYLYITETSQLVVGPLEKRSSSQLSPKGGPGSYKTHFLSSVPQMQFFPWSHGQKTWCSLSQDQGKWLCWTLAHA